MRKTSREGLNGKNADLMGFLWILHGPHRPHGDRTPVRPHKVSYKVSLPRDWMRAMSFVTCK